MGEGINIHSAGKTRRQKQHRDRAAGRLAAKHDINGGLTNAQAVALSIIENKDRTLKTERITVVDSNGRTVARSKSGTRRRTSLPASAIPPDSVITHNHPQDTSLGLGAGTSFSGADIAAAVSTNAREIRVVAGDYTYSMRRPKGGWGVSAAEVKKAYDAGYASYGKSGAEYIRQSRSASEHRNRVRRVNTAYTNAVNRDMAKRFGWEYTRTRTRD